MTTGNKRIAFAVGKFAPTAPVVMIVRGRPSKARNKLDSAHYAKASNPYGVNVSSIPKKPIHENHGQLVWDSKEHVLVMECAKKPSPLLERMFRNFYQKQWKLAPFWKVVKFRNLSADAESSPDDREGDDAETTGAAMVEPVDPDIAKLTEAAIVDEWRDENAGLREPTPSHKHLDAEGDSTADALSANAGKTDADERTVVADPAIKVNAEKLTESLLEVQNKLGISDTADRAEVKARFERVLENADQQRLQSNGAEPKPDQAGDQDGINGVTEVLVAMGTTLARQRGLLGSNERPDGSRIRAMVAKDWNLHQNDEPAVIVQRLLKVVGLSFANDDDTLRGFLGLRPFDKVIPVLLARWQDAHAGVVTRIEEIKSTVEETLQREDPTDSVEKRGGSWQKVDQIQKDLHPARLEEDLRALKGAKGEERLQKAAGLRATIDDHRRYIDGSVVIAELDRNPFGIEPRVHDTFATVLTEILETIPTGIAKPG
jgi:hypothetical protein